MKTQLSVLASLVAVLSLTGCQSTTEPVVTETTNQQVEPCEIAHTNIDDAADCEVAKEGVIEVIHPQEDVAVDIAVPKETAEEAPVVISDVWARIANQLEMAVPDDSRVTVQKNWYLKHPEYMARVVKRAKPFLYFIVEEIEKRDMPLELALLPIVESAFDPFAYSWPGCRHVAVYSRYCQALWYAAVMVV